MSARVRRPGAIQVHGVTTEHDVIWQIGNGPVRETSAGLVLSAESIIDKYPSGLAGLSCEGSTEYVNESDLNALNDALKARNRGDIDPLCLSCHRASVVLGLDVCSGCNDGAELVTDEPRRVEPDSAWIDVGDDRPGPNVDEHGRDMTPGQSPTRGAL
jgi:hypothetical protein